MGSEASDQVGIPFVRRWHRLLVVGEPNTLVAEIFPMVGGIYIVPCIARCADQIN